MSLLIDHIVLCVDDLEEAGVEVERRFGLHTLAGGKHQGHGTANRIVPLGSSYLELVAVLDREEAATSVFGQWVAERAARGLEAHAICLRSNDLDSICDRLGLAAVSMSRTKPDGSELKWRLAGLDEMISRGTPFYIEWDIDPMDHPGKADGAANAVVKATLAGDPRLLRRWTADAEGISLEAGEPGIVAIELQISDSVYRL